MRIFKMAKRTSTQTYFPENVILNSKKVILNNKLLNTNAEKLYIRFTDGKIEIFLESGLVSALVYQQKTSQETSYFIQKLASIILSESEGNSLEKMLGKICDNNQDNQVSQDVEKACKAIKVLSSNSICFGKSDYPKNSGIILTISENKPAVFDVDGKIEAINFIVNFFMQNNA